MAPDKKQVRALEDHLAELSIQVLTTTQALIEARRAAGMAVTGSPTLSRNEGGKARRVRHLPLQFRRDTQKEKS